MTKSFGKISLAILTALLILSTGLFIALMPKVQTAQAEGADDEICYITEFGNNMTQFNMHPCRTVDEIKEVLKKDATPFENYDGVVFNIYADLELPEIDFSKISAWLQINLNGHTLKITGSRNYTKQHIVINGENGVIDFSGDSVTHEGSIFTLTKVSDNYKNSGIEIKDVTFQNIKADRLFNIQDFNNEISVNNWLLENIIVKDSTFSQNGGVFYINKTNENNTIKFEDFVFENINTSADGGAIYLNKAASGNTDGVSLYLNNIEFTNCNSTDGNGGVVFVNSPEDVKIDNCNFSNCTSKENGGVIYFNVITGNIDIEDCNFSDCSSGDDGGAIYIAGLSGNIQMTNCNFLDCSSGVDGGAIYAYKVGEAFEMQGCNFLNCSSGDDGGAIFIGENCDGAFFGWLDSAYYHKPLFYNCSAKGYGGAIYINKADGCTLENMIFVNNEAKNSEWGGGAIHVYGKDTTIAYCEFYFNTGAGYGGAVSVDADGVIFSCCTFGGNKSNKGEDVYVATDRNAKELSDCTFYYGTSKEKCVQGDEFDVTNGNAFVPNGMMFSDSSNYEVGELVKGDSHDNPIIIKNYWDMIALAINLKYENETYKGLYYKLENDLNSVCIPIRNFTGEFDFNKKHLSTRLVDKIFDESKCVLIDPSVKNVFGKWDRTSNVVVNYIDCSSGTQENKSTQATIIYDSDDITELNEGSYYILGTVNLENRIIIKGNVKIIFGKGAILNANNGIELQDENILSLYSSDANDKGTLNAKSTDKVGAGIGGSYASKNVVINPEDLEELGDTRFSAAGGYMGTLNVVGVNVNAEGNGGAGIGGGKGDTAQYVPIYKWNYYYNCNETTRVHYYHSGMGGQGGTLNVYDAIINAVGNGGRDIGGGDGGNGVTRYDSFWASDYIFWINETRTPAGGGDGGTINVYSGVINAKNNGIGGGNGGGYEDYEKRNISSNYYAKYEHPNGGDGGTINLYGGQIFANTINGGAGVSGIYEYKFSGEISETLFPAGQKGAKVVFGETDFTVKVGKSFDELGAAVAYVDTMNDSVIGTKCVNLNNFADSCVHVDENEDGVCDNCHCYLEVYVTFHSDTTSLCVYNLGDNITSSIKESFPKIKNNILKCYRSDGTEIAYDEIFTIEDVGHIHIYCVIKCQVPIGEMRFYYFNSFDGCYYENAEATIKIEDLSELFLSGFTRLDFVMSEEQFKLYVGNFAYVRVEMEFSPLEYTSSRTVAATNSSYWEFFNYEGGSIFDIGNEAVSIRYGYGYDSSVFRRFGGVEESKLTLGEKYNVTFGYTSGQYNYIYKIEQDGQLKYTKTRSLNSYLNEIEGHVGFFMSDMALHSCKIFSNNILIFDLIPVMDALGNIYLFNKCNYEFITGNFTTLQTKLVDLGSPYGEVYYCAEDGKYYKDIFGCEVADVYNITYTGDYEGTYFGDKASFSLPICHDEGYNYLFKVDGKIWNGNNLFRNVLAVTVEKTASSEDYYDQVDFIRNNTALPIAVKESPYLTVEMEFVPLEYTSGKTVAATDGNLWRFFNNNSGCAFDVGNIRLGAVANSNLTLGKKYYVSFGYKNDKGTDKVFLLIKQNGNQVYYQEEAVNITSLSVGQSDIAIFMSNMALYYCKVYDNGTLVRDFIPVIDDSNNYYVFDKTNQSFYLANNFYVPELVNLGSPYGEVYCCAEEGIYYKDIYCFESTDILDITFEGDYEGRYLGYIDDLVLPVCTEEGYIFIFEIDGKFWDMGTLPRGIVTIVVKKQQYMEINYVRSKTPLAIGVNSSIYTTMEIEFVPYEYTHEITIGGDNTWAFINDSARCTFNYAYVISDGITTFYDIYNMGHYDTPALVLGKKCQLKFGYVGGNYEKLIFQFSQPNGPSYLSTNPLDKGSDYANSRMIYLFMNDMAVSHCKVYDHETLVRDFIPIMDEFNNYYLLDKVNNKLYLIENHIVETEAVDLGQPFGELYYSHDFARYYKDSIGQERADILDITYTGDYEGTYLGYKNEFVLPVCAEEGKSFVFVVDGKVWDGTTFMKDKFTVNVLSVKKHDKIDATCTTDGHEGYYEYDDEYYSDEICMQKIEDLATWLSSDGDGFIEALGHDYQITYEWDGDECTATYSCIHGCGIDEVIETVKGEYVKDSDASCGASEKGHYKATFTNELFSEQTTEENSVINGDPLEHDYEITYEWNGQDCTATAICKYDNSHTATETITGVYVKDTDATETTYEFGHYEATFENEIFEKQSTEANGVKVNKTQIAKPQANATSFVYNGQEQTYVLTENANYTITNNTKTNVGTYEVKVALNDKINYEWTDGTQTDLEFNFVITKATNEILTLSLDCWNYGETPNTPTATAKFGEVKLVYSKATPRDFSITTLPTEAGNYIVKAYVDENDNYTSADKELKFSIIFISQDKEGNPIEEPQVSIVDSGNAIPEGAVFVVETIDMEDTTATSGSTEALKDNGKLSNNEKVYAIYDAELLIENAPVQPNGNIKLKMQIPEELLGKQFKIYHIHTEGTTKEVIEIDNADVDDEGYVTFETNKLSQFAFVAEDPDYTENTNSNNNNIVLIISLSAIVLVATAVTIFFVTKKKKGKNK